MHYAPRLVNLTPHQIDVFAIFEGRSLEEHLLFSVPPSGQIARVLEKDTLVSKGWMPDHTNPERERPQDKSGAVWAPWALDSISSGGSYCMESIYVLRSYGMVEGLPDPVREDPVRGRGKRTLYIVSLPVFLALPSRRDIIAPDTGPGQFGAVRDDKGRIIGCRRFLAHDPAWVTGCAGWPASEWEAANR